MFKKMGIPLIAIAGILFSLFIIYRGARKPAVAPIPFAPPTIPFAYYIAAEGMIESVYKNIPIGVPFPELVTAVYVEVGDLLKKGQPLLKLDTRSLEAQLAQARKEEENALTDYQNKKNQFSYYERLKDRKATSESAYATAHYDMKLAEDRLATATAAVQVVATNIERSTARAPIDGEVLQINIRIGQYANVNPFDKLPIMLFGDTAYYHLRIDIDEEESWRFVAGSRARAFVRGNSQIAIDLEYVYQEPYITPKQNLTGSDTERVDTRVLQVVYRFDKKKYPVFVGQLLDVYIDSQAQR